MSVRTFNGDQLLVYLNSSNVNLDANGNPISALDDSDFTTFIRPINLSEKSNWVIGVVDVSFMNPNYNNSFVPLPNQGEPISVISDVGINVRDGSDTTNILYLTEPSKLGNGVLFYGEKNFATAVAWRPIRNRVISNINIKLRTRFSNDPVAWNGIGTRPFTSITLCIRKV